MRRIMIALWVLLLSTATWGEIIGNGVEVEVLSDKGGELPIYPYSATGDERKVYAEATKGDCYRIVVRNRLDRRVGIVIAVDGRNIISGKKSWLKSSERMYILGPYETGTYEGWRTGNDKVNRFYFTDAGGSYAAAFKDESAMGIVALAVFPEIIRYQILPQEYHKETSSAPPEGGRNDKAAPSAKALDRAGTGYGEEVYSPSRVVAFEPEPTSLERILIKYEWRETLCRLGIIPCGKPCKPRNRFWDDDGFAPPPPGRN